MSFEEFKEFLSTEIGLTEEEILKLTEGGFDDIESLHLATAATLKLLGFEDPD